jgi:hypothetical protein
MTDAASLNLDPHETRWRIDQVFFCQFQLARRNSLLLRDTYRESGSGLSYS